MRHIPATELTVGCSVIGNTGVETVRSIHGHEGYRDREDVHVIYKHLIGVEENGNQYNLAEIKPVSISEEMMENLGFQKDFQNDYMKPWRGIMFYFRLSDFTLRIGYGSKAKIKGGLVSLHKLQQVWLAITDEQLNYKQ